ncbi:MAG: chorismate mutase [Chitinophagales bacterium]|nr:bifunctional 3-deoxy-7-phosphoheptulonate synthase/chorismate mutase type II [Bacteroidota bacterium]MCB9042523.1 bifunctional 3-deoxy-7-phosphoheptulonate synthase/chorismate mutase type II [Chitinophagales bacterium]
MLEAISDFTTWGLPQNRPIFIAGPCSVESPTQVMQTALGLKDSGIQFLRGGIWKPRTRPNSFEGIGSQGLQWLKDAGNAINVPVMTEVANAKHVYEALRNQIDVLWIGARTTVNPFSVQEIADALRGVDIPVFVKNPINPDLALWIGALERLQQSGIRKIAAIHRGFSSHADSRYRNIPLWEIPIELKRRIPDLPIIIDPSHIAGKRELLFDLSQKAFDLDFNGIIIETHITPDKALSDAAQQITPEQFVALKKNIVLRKSAAENPDFNAELEHLRHEIDLIDEEILQIFAKRMTIAEKIGLCKQKNKVTILQKDRWDTILRTRIEDGSKKGLSQDFVVNMYNNIHKESIRHQTKIMNQDSGERKTE